MLADFIGATTAETTVGVTTTTVSEETVDLPAALEVVNQEVQETASIFSDIFSPILEDIPSILFAIVFGIVGVILVRWIVRILTRALDRSKLDGIMSGFIRSVVRITLYVLLCIVVLSLVGVPMTSIVAVIASVCVTIGLALQDSLTNVAGGFILLFAKPIKEGDTVEVNGITGKVEGVSILYTRIVTPDNKLVYIPNGAVSEEKIINYTAKALRRVDLQFGIAYESDIDKAREVLLAVVHAMPEALDEPEPAVLVSAHDESSVTMTLRVWAKNENYWALYYGLLENVKKAFDEKGISIPYPQMDVHLSETSAAPQKKSTESRENYDNSSQN